MKKTNLILIVLLIFCTLNAFSQKYGRGPREKFGNTLNAGAGIGYYKYIGEPIVYANLNYEIDVFRNVTLAPFVGFYTYTNTYYWKQDIYPGKNYIYRENAIPIGVKGAYYFDELLHAKNRWDFYGAVSLGYVANNIRWEEDFNGDHLLVPHANPRFLAVHMGGRYHINNRVGAFLDIATSVSTIGLSFKF